MDHTPSEIEYKVVLREDGSNAQDAGNKGYISLALFPKEYDAYIMSFMAWGTRRISNRDELDEFENTRPFKIEDKVDVLFNQEIDDCLDELVMVLPDFPKDELETRTKNLIYGVVFMYLFGYETVENYSGGIHDYTMLVQATLVLCGKHPPENRTHFIRFLRCISLFLYHRMKETVDQKLSETGIVPAPMEDQ
jgi:hypothetical protein